MKYSIFLAVVAFGLIGQVHFVSAETVLRASEQVSIAEDQVVQGDFYGAGEAVVVSGSVEGDFLVAAERVTVNGKIQEDLMVLAADTQVHAPVTGDVRVLGGSVLLAETVEGDVFVVGGSLQLLSSASVTGDVYFFGGEAEILGAVGGSVVAQAESVRIDAPIGGAVDMTLSDTLTLGSRAFVEGDLTHVGPNDPVRATGSVVAGELLLTAPAPAERNTEELLMPFLVLLFGVLVLWLLLRPSLEQMVPMVAADYTTLSLIGAAGLFFAPPLIVVLLLSVLGSVIGTWLLFAFLALVVAAVLLIPFIIAGTLATVFKQQANFSVWWALAGGIATVVIAGLPVVGGFILLAAGLVALGFLMRSSYRTLSAGK